MENSFNLSIIIAICFLIFKFAELKITQKELIPLKDLFKECFIVFISCLASFFVYDQFSDNFNASTPTASVFTGDPSF